MAAVMRSVSAACVLIEDSLTTLCEVSDTAIPGDQGPNCCGPWCRPCHDGRRRSSPCSDAAARGGGGRVPPSHVRKPRPRRGGRVEVWTTRRDERRRADGGRLCDTRIGPGCLVPASGVRPSTMTPSGRLAPLSASPRTRPVRTWTSADVPRDAYRDFDLCPLRGVTSRRGAVGTAATSRAGVSP